MQRSWGKDVLEISQGKEAVVAVADRVKGRVLGDEIQKAVGSDHRGSCKLF